MFFDTTWAEPVLEYLMNGDDETVLEGIVHAQNNTVMGFTAGVNCSVRVHLAQDRASCGSVCIKLSPNASSGQKLVVTCADRRNASTCGIAYAAALLLAWEARQRGCAKLDIPELFPAEWLTRAPRQLSFTPSLDYLWAKGDTLLTEQPGTKPLKSGGQGDRPWWREFLDTKSPGKREDLLKKQIRKSMSNFSPWAVEHYARQMLESRNPVTILRKFHQSVMKQGMHREIYGELHEFLEGEEAARLEAEAQRQVTVDDLVQWLLQSGADSQNEINPTAVDVVWLGIPTELGFSLLCFQLLVTTRKVVRKPRQPQGIVNLSNELRRGSRSMAPIESRLVHWLAERPETRNSYYSNDFTADPTTIPVRGVLSWIATWGATGRIKWSDESPLRFDPRGARLCALERNGALAWMIEFPPKAPDGEIIHVPLAETEVFVDENALGSSDRQADCYARFEDVLVPLDTRSMPLKVLSGLRSMPEVPLDPLRFTKAGEQFVRRFCLSPGQSEAGSPARQIHVTPVLEFRLDNTTLSLTASAQSADGHRFVRNHTGKWCFMHDGAPHPSTGDPESEQMPVEDVQNAAVDAEQAAEAADAGASHDGPLTIAYIPSLRDTGPVDQWITRILPRTVRPIQNDSRTGLEWSADPAAVVELLRNWQVRPTGVTYYGNLAFRNLVTVREAPKFNINVESSGTDWLQVSVEMEQELETLSLEEAIAALSKSDDGLILLRGGRVYKRESLEQYRNDMEVLSVLGLSAAPGTQRLHAMQMAGIPADELLQLEGTNSAIRKLAEESRRLLTTFAGIPAAPADATTAGFLRPYQRVGTDFVTWAARTFGGALLADDMGLGKTIQVLAALTALRNADVDSTGRPSLVICPASVTHNWQREAQRFAPGLRVQVLERGPGRESLLRRAIEFDVLVTNQALTRRDINSLRRHSWFLIVIDEAQAIKNPEAEITRAVKSLNASYRLALTGTPVENRVSDLWSILDFAVPGHLGSLARLVGEVNGPNQSLAYRGLRSRLRPVLLRRLKTEVAPELPERIEERIDCEMTPGQRKVYLSEVKKVRAMLENVGGEKVTGKARIQMLAAITRLRQLCCDPALVSLTGTGSGKVDELMSLIPELIEEGHKVLIFSQFVRMLQILRDRLMALNIPLYMLTGSTVKREQLVETFESDTRPGVFLISLKAGGTGLNLVSASHVVIFDPWWNPAVEAQAIDRTHRIGQDKTVVAFRLVTSGTIEERVTELQEKKRAVLRSVLEDDAFNRTLTREDFEYLLTPYDESH